MVLLVLLFAFLGHAIWPYPSSSSLGNTVSVCSSSFSFSQVVPNTIISDAITRYKSIIFSNAASSPPGCTLSELSISLSNASVTQTDYGIDESYLLDISASSAVLKAENFVGALRGLETFSQMFSINATLISSGSVTDKPRFPWRGIMIDSARHFLPIDTIKKLIDGMAYMKLNVLHWHLVDAESYPLSVPQYPKLSGSGAWNSKSVYSAQDLESVVSYANARGIRTVPEVDMPGHSYAVGKGYPNLVASCPQYSHNINNVPLNPANNDTFPMVSSVLSYLRDQFGDSYMHLGGDEVVYGCWLEDPSVVKYMRDHGIATANDLYLSFLNTVSNDSSKLNRKNVWWEEAFLSGFKVPSQDVIQVWKDSATLKSVAAANSFATLSYGWYFANTVQWDWIDYYNNEPFSGTGWTSSMKSFVLGGEACAWGERLNQYNFEQVIFPRAAAVAERLWSPEYINDTNNALPRLVDTICMLQRRGINSGPVVPNACDEE